MPVYRLASAQRRIYTNHTVSGVFSTIFLRPFTVPAGHHAIIRASVAIRDCRHDFLSVLVAGRRAGVRRAVRYWRPARQMETRAADRGHSGSGRYAALLLLPGADVREALGRLHVDPRPGRPDAYGRHLER